MTSLNSKQLEGIQDPLVTNMYAVCLICGKTKEVFPKDYNKPLFICGNCHLGI